MPVSYTYDDLFLEVAATAFRGQEVVDLTTTSAGTTTTAVFAQLAYGASGATTTRFHDQFLYLRRVRGTATAGAATTITLESGHTFATNALANFTIRITSGTGSGQEKIITSNTNANPSVVTVPTWTTNPDSTSVYAIYPSSSALPVPTVVRTSKVLSTGSFVVASGTANVAPAYSIVIANRADMLFCGINPDELRRGINTALSSLRFLSYLPVTLVPDGDMEDSYTLGSAESFSQWWMVNAPTSAAKSSTNYPFPFGRQYLDVATGATATDKGVQSATVAVDDSESLYAAVFVQKTPTATETGNFKVVLYDVTNSSALKTVTVTGQQPVIVYFQQSPNSTTEEVAVRVVGATATASNFRIGPVCLWSSQKRRYALDTSSVVRSTDVRGLYTLPLGQQTETDVYLVGRALELLTRRVERDDRANLVNLVSGAFTRPPFMQVYQRWPELTYDTETTFADKKTVAQGALYYVEMARARSHYADNSELANKYERNARVHLRNFFRLSGIDPVEFEEILTPRVMVPFA